MKDKLNITIRVADLQPIAMGINREEEPDIRHAEYQVNQLWKAWTKKFSGTSSHEVLGMVAFQFAKALILQNKRLQETEALLENFDKDLDKILLDVGGNDSPEEPRLPL